MVQNNLREHKERNQSVFSARKVKTVNMNRQTFCQTASVTNRLIEPSVTTNKAAPIELCDEISKCTTKIFVLDFDHHLLLACVYTYVSEGKVKILLECGKWWIGDIDRLIPNLGTRWR
jgi:hypothetical protein